MSNELDTIFEETAALLEEGGEAVADYELRRRSQDRSIIAYLVVGSFVLFIAALTGRVLFSNWEDLKDPATFLLSMLSSVLLPVVTLVIGTTSAKNRHVMIDAPHHKARLRGSGDAARSLDYTEPRLGWTGHGVRHGVRTWGQA